MTDKDKRGWRDWPVYPDDNEEKEPKDTGPKEEGGQEGEVDSPFSGGGWRR
jgi:hypothetical protein